MKEAQVKKYIELVYAQDSELSKLDNLADRKVQAIEQVGGDPASPVSRDIMELKSTDVNQQIFEFIKNNNSNRYALLNMRQQLFWELQERLMKPLTSKHKGNKAEVDVDDDTLLKAVITKTTISDKAEVLLEGIDKLYREIFIDSEEVDMAAKILKSKSPESRLKKKAI